MNSGLAGAANAAGVVLGAETVVTMLPAGQHVRSVYLGEEGLLAEAALQHQQRVVVTSYMEHPVGQAFAAWEAARLGLQFPGLVGLCGLQTHHLFEPDEFSEMLGPWSPSFQVPAGYGLGFDDLLEALPWTRLY